MLESQHPELVPPDQAWAAVSDLLYSEGEHNRGDLYRQLPPLIARTVETIGWGNLWEMHRAYCVGGKPGMDRVAFMQQYTPMYEREKAKAMTPRAITAGIDTALATLPDSSQKLIEDREAGRRAKENEYRSLIEWNQRQIRQSIEQQEKEHQERLEQWREEHPQAPEGIELARATLRALQDKEE